MTPPKRINIKTDDESSAADSSRIGKSSSSKLSGSIKKPSKSKEMTIGMSDEELVNMDIKDLNDYLRRLPKDAANDARKRRRLLKNRGYAQSTRTKRITTIEDSAMRKSELEKEITLLRRENERLKERRDILRMTRAHMDHDERMRGGGNDGGFRYVKKEVD